MERPAAEGDQGVLAGIEPAIDGEHADGIDHVLVGDVDDRLRRFHPVQPEALSQLIDPLFRLRFAEPDGATRK